ncbi:MAG: DUF167 domain-containing protein [Deinococcus sp.]|nr:DUF167 domain-containing protein [Deinococcus sp.]
MTLAVWVQPRAKRTEVAGRHGEVLKIRLAAPPVEGAANAVLCQFLAEALDLPQSAVTVVRGHTSRRKLVAITGASAEAVAKLG